MEINIDIENSRLLKDHIYTSLKNEIIIGNLKTGDAINILELANKLSISSAPIREALGMLSKDGFISLSPRRQAVVSEISRQDWKIIVDMRMLLEPYSARIAASMIPDDKISELRVQMERVLLNPMDLYAYIEADKAIHHALHAYNGSNMLSVTLSNLKEHTMRAKYYSKDISNAQRENIAVQATLEHMAILDSFCERDGERAAKAAHDHLTRYIERVSASNP